MKEYKFDNAIVRVHGEPNMERIKQATIKFMKEVEKKKKKNKQNR